MATAAEKLRCLNLSWELDEAKETLEYLRERTRDNPLFAVLTGVMHGGNVDYDGQQPYVEEMVKHPPEKLLDEKFVEGIVTKKIGERRNMILGAAHLVAGAVDCYIKHCGHDGKKCLKDKDALERYISCARGVKFVHVRANGRPDPRPAHGVKAAALVREYFGSTDTPPIDTHGDSWLCDNLVCCSEGGHVVRLKYGRAYEKSHTQMADCMVEQARRCGISPDVLQVAAWIHGACKARIKKGLYFIGLGKDMTIPCRLPGVAPLIESAHDGDAMKEEDKMDMVRRLKEAKRHVVEAQRIYAEVGQELQDLDELELSEEVDGVIQSHEDDKEAVDFVIGELTRKKRCPDAR